MCYYIRNITVFSSCIMLLQKQEHQRATGTNPDQLVSQQASRVVRQFPQTQPVADNVAERKRLSKDVLSGVSISLLEYNHIYFTLIY